MDVLRLTPVDIYGATTTPITFTFSEVRGIRYGNTEAISSFETANGYAKHFVRAVGRTIAFEIVVIRSETIKKIDDFANYILLGYSFNCNVLQGMLSHNVALNEAQFSASRGVISNGKVIEWKADWQNAIGNGQEFGEALPVLIKEGAKESEPKKGDYVSAPPIGGGN